MKPRGPTIPRIRLGLKRQAFFVAALLAVMALSSFFAGCGSAVSTIPSDVVPTGTSSEDANSADVVALSDGSTYTAADLVAAKAYESAIMPLVKGQFELVDVFDSVHQLGHVPNATHTQSYRDAMRGQQALCDALRSIEPPPFVQKEHEVRVLAAQYFADATARISGSWASGDTSRLNEGVALYQKAYETWQEAEALLASWEKSFQTADLANKQP